MKTSIIHKYQLNLSNVTQMQWIENLPVDSKVVKVAIQDICLVVWILKTIEDDPHPRLDRRIGFRLVFTGQEFDAAWLNYLDTVQHPSGLVYHVFTHVG